MRRLFLAAAAGWLLGLAQPAAAKPTSEPVQPAPALLQVKWVVPDAHKAAVEVVEWVRRKGGLAVMTSDRHVSLKLPSALVAELFQRYSGTPAPDVPSSSLWITVSLELVSAP